MDKEYQELHKEARFRLPKAEEYDGEIFEVEIFRDDRKYTTFHFKKMYGLQHEYSVDWVIDGCFNHEL